MKINEWISSILFILLYIWVFSFGWYGLLIGLLMLFIPTFICIYQIVSSNSYTSKIWKPLYISYIGLVILIVIIILRINSWIYERKNR